MTKQGLKKDRFSFADFSEAFATWKAAVPNLLDRNFPVKLDDIDHLGNRRVRGVGELLENQIRVGLAQMSRVIRDRMSVQDKSLITPRNLLNTAPLVGIIRKFFGTSQLSQFMDQINPLSEITHKRRLSALGPGGLNRKRAGFEVRDVHYTHYGRVCPIETPEGPNIGLIVSLASHAKHQRVRPDRVALPQGRQGQARRSRVPERRRRERPDRRPGQHPARQGPDRDRHRRRRARAATSRSSSPPASTTWTSRRCRSSPFPPRSCRSSSTTTPTARSWARTCMRQAVPLLMPEWPRVGTGMEEQVASDSGACIVARRPGKVIYSSGDLIAVAAENAKSKKDSIDLYRLRKYSRSNQDTCINQTAMAVTGTQVKAGDVLADGSACAEGQLALGRNLLVGFMPWEGYNFEDAILLSEKLVKEDIFTSIHISEFEVEARDTKLGPEEITRDIPNVGTESLEALDEPGVVIPSTVVRQGDILVGKVTPKGEQQLTPEERLLKVIFGKKAEDVQDASLRVPPGVSGKIIGTRVFVRREKLAKGEERKRLDAIQDKLDADFATLQAAPQGVVRGARVRLRRQARDRRRSASSCSTRRWRTSSAPTPPARRRTSSRATTWP